MEKEPLRAGITRKDFCKGLGLGLAALGLGGFSLEALAQSPSPGGFDDPSDDFTLRALRRIIETYELPSSGFDPEGGWVHNYYIYTWTSGLLRHEAELVLSRAPGPKGHRLSGACRRPGLSAYSHFVQLQADCLSNTLGTPRNWLATTKMALKIDQPPYLHTGGKTTGKAAGRTIELDHGVKKRTYTLSEPFTLRWCLFEAVQRLERDPAQRLDFTLVDEFDQLWPAQSLTFHKQLRLQLASGPQVLTGYAHTGRGMSYPTVYWVDEAGRALLCFSGLNLWVLHDETGQRLLYDDQAIKVADFRQQPAGGGY